MLKLYPLHTICYNSNMFRSILIIFSELLDINKSLCKEHVDGLLSTLKFVRKMFADIIRFVDSNAEMVHKKQTL